MRVFKIVTILILLFSQYVYAWDCKTHAYIAYKAGIKIPEAACLPDIIRDENPAVLAPLHYHNATTETIVTPQYIDAFSVKETTITSNGREINILLPHQAGVLYWKIIDIYKKMKNLDRAHTDGKLSYEYYLTAIAHYIGDLSQPLHNFPYSDTPASDGKIYLEEGKFNKENHIKFDESFSQYRLADPKIEEKVENSIKQIDITSEEDLKKEVAKLANSSISLAKKCFSEKRIPTEEELINQISWSISLLKAIIKATN